MSAITHTNVMAESKEAMKSGGWWTPAEIARRINARIESADAALLDLLDHGFVERRHLGSDRRGDLYAYRLREFGRGVMDPLHFWTIVLVVAILIVAVTPA